jgi:hypothetical protein
LYRGLVFFTFGSHIFTGTGCFWFTFTS